VTSDGGLLLVRELDERLGLSELIREHLRDGRQGKNTQLPLSDLLRQSIYSRLAGYEDVNDAERLAQDPTFRLMGSETIWERGAALTSRLQSFGAVEPRREPQWFGFDEPRTDRQGRNRSLSAESSAGHGQHRDPRLLANRRTAPTTGILSPPPITRCYCSTARATVWRRSCAPEMCTAPTTGKNC